MNKWIVPIFAVITFVVISYFLFFSTKKVSESQSSSQNESRNFSDKPKNQKNRENSRGIIKNNDLDKELINKDKIDEINVTK